MLAFSTNFTRDLILWHLLPDCITLLGAFPDATFQMPPLFITVVKDICAINTFEKLRNILFSEVYCWYFGITTLLFSVTITDMSLYEVLHLFPRWPLVFWSISLSPTRRPWCIITRMRQESLFGAFGLFALQVCCTCYVGMCLNNVDSLASIISGLILFCSCGWVRIFLIVLLGLKCLLEDKLR